MPLNSQKSGYLDRISSGSDGTGKSASRGDGQDHADHFAPALPGDRGGDTEDAHTPVITPGGVNQLPPAWHPPLLPPKLKPDPNWHPPMLPPMKSIPPKLEDAPLSAV